MPTFVALLMALLPAAVITSVCFLAGFAIQSLWTGQFKHLPADYLSSVAMFAFETALAHAVLLGTPLFLGLYHLKWLRWWSSMLAGLVLASTPIGIQSWPLRHAAPHVTTAVIRGGKLVQTMVNGVPTWAGWLEYARSIGIYAALGAIGGLAFWLFWRKVRRALERTSVPR
jgi:hypothetical protein